MITLGQLKRDLSIIEALRMDPETSEEHRLANQEVNRAVRQLMKKGDWWSTLQEYCFNTCSECIFLPPEIMRVIHIDTNCSHARVYGRNWRYLDNGPGDCWCGPEGLMDSGQEQLLTQPKAPSGILIVADNCEEDAVVTIVAKDVNRRKVTTHTQTCEGKVCRQSIDLPVSADAPILWTEENIIEICQITKTATCGAVHIFAFRDGQPRELIATLYPEDTFPTYRKYRLSSSTFPVVPAAVRLLAKRKHTLLYDDAQAVAIESVDAIAAMIRYNHAVRDGDRNGAFEEMETALEFLDDCEYERTGSDEPTIEFNMTNRLGSFDTLRSY